MGRKPHQPTADTRAEVKTRRALGWDVDSIAALLRMSTSTLYKHYRYELETGVAKGEGEVLDLIWTAARKGQAWAVDRLLTRFETIRNHPQAVRGTLRELNPADLSMDVKLAILEARDKAAAMATQED